MKLYQSTFPIAPPAVRDNINYPGVPLQPGDEPPPIAARTTSRAVVQYEIYVLQYSGRQARHTFIMAFGVAVAILATYYLDGRPQYLAIALAVAFILTGAVGYHTTQTAHATFTEHLAVATSTTYQEPRPLAQGERPFVPSTDRPATIKVGRFPISPPLLAALIDTGANNGWRLTRDAATRVLPRNLYRDWQATVGELQRLGYLDDQARPTAAAWAFIGRRPPLPQSDNSHPGAQSTHARRTHGAHDALQTVEEWGGA